MFKRCQKNSVFRDSSIFHARFQAVQRVSSHKIQDSKTPRQEKLFGKNLAPKQKTSPPLKCKQRRIKKDPPYYTGYPVLYQTEKTKMKMPHQGLHCAQKLNQT